jgi:hypothetical protein
MFLLTTLERLRSDVTEYFDFSATAAERVFVNLKFSSVFVDLFVHSVG